MERNKTITDYQFLLVSKSKIKILNYQKGLRNSNFNSLDKFKLELMKTEVTNVLNYLNTLNGKVKLAKDFK